MLGHHHLPDRNDRPGDRPRSVPVLYFVLGTLLIGSTRFAAKWVLNAGTGMRRDEEPIFIYGAGATAAQLARRFARAREPLRHGLDR